MEPGEIVKLAKEGRPQAIATLINKSLQPKGLMTKVSSNNGCLVIQVEAETVPPQTDTVSFIKNGLFNLKPANISQVIVQARVSGQNTNSWQESFNLVVPESTKLARQPDVEVLSPPLKRTSTSYVSVNASKPVPSPPHPVMGFLRTRNGERLGLVLGTAALTSICWLGVGALGSHTNRSASVAPTSGNQTGSDPTSVQSTSSTADAPASELYTIKGTFQLVDSDIGGTPSDCYGTGGYDDVESGMPVTVRDGQGGILATGKVGTGSQPSGNEYSSVICVFEFQVESVPKANFYSIEIGRRGNLNYSFSEMQQKEWTVSLSLGT